MRRSMLLMIGFSQLCGAAGFAQGDGALDLDWLYETGTRWAEEYLPADWLEEYELPAPADWNRFWSGLEQVLDSGDFSDLAWLLPEARWALDLLRNWPAAEPYAAWLEQRIVYLVMADAAVQAHAAGQRRPSAPTTSLRTPPRPGPPRPPPAAQHRIRQTASRRAHWDQQLSQRPAPQRAAALVPDLKAIFSEAGLPPELVWLAEVESSFNPAARSPVGATGLFQFMPATADRFGLRLKPDDERLNPQRSAHAAAQYLRFLYGRFDSWPLALAAYNAGEGRVGRLLRTHNGSRFEDIAAYLPAETQMYVPKVLATVALREGLDPDTLPPPTPI